MVWTSNDEFLLSTGLDGAIIEWRVADWSCKKFIQTNSRYTTVMYYYQNNTIFAAGTEVNRHVVREIKLDKD
jgi:hypothetical protein